LVLDIQGLIVDCEAVGLDRFILKCLTLLEFAQFEYYKLLLLIVIQLQTHGCPKDLNHVRWTKVR